MSSDPILELRGVEFAYPQVGASGRGRRLALEGVALRIHGGERIAILGANGSGKSTLLSHLNGLLRPDKGEVLLEGVPFLHDRRNLAHLRSRVASVFQNADDQLFGATVREDVSFGPLQQGWDRERVRRSVEAELSRSGLVECADHDPLTLSHGLRKRVAIAGAMVIDPRVLVLDEPTSGLDPASEDDLRDRLMALSEEGVAMVVSTHDVDFAASFAQRVVVLQEGRVRADGPCAEILSDRAMLRDCRLRSPRSLVGMARVRVAPVQAREGGLHVLSLHPSALVVAQRLQCELEASWHTHSSHGAQRSHPFERLADRLAELWNRAEGIVVLAPVGLCVRSIAPLLGTKRTDPAVVCCDVHGRWAVSLLSAHEGGANDLAHRVAEILEAEPVVTTTSEAARTLVAGIGCRRGVAAPVISEALDLALERLGVDRSALRLLATSEAKVREAGIREVSRTWEIPLRIVSHREIRSSRRRVRTTAARRHFPIPAVSQPAALLAGKRTECVLRMFVHRGVTVSIARELSAWWGSDRETRSTVP